MEENSYLKKKPKRNYTIVLVAVMCVIAIIAAYVINYNTPAKQVERLLLQGDRFLADMNYEEAIASYTGAISIDPKNEEVKDRIEAGFDEWAKELIKTGNYEEAVAKIESAMTVIGNTDKLIDTEILALQEMAKESLEKNDFDTATNIAERIKGLDSVKGDELLAQINDRKAVIEEEAKVEEFKSYAQLVSASRTAFYYMTHPSYDTAEWLRQDMLYITYDAAHESYDSLINGLEDYIQYLKENPVDALIMEKYERIMNYQGGDLAQTERIDGIEYLTLSSAYNLLVMAYLRVGDMEKALAARRKLAEFMGDEGILGIHTFSYDWNDFEYIIDGYGRMVEWTNEGEHWTATYGGNGLGADHVVLDHTDENGHTTSTTYYTYDNGRWASEVMEEHGILSGASFDSNVRIDYTYTDGGVHGDYHSDITYKGSKSESNLEWDYSVDKYGAVH